MRDIWAFLLQTLTASGVAIMLLIVKAMFRDKLPPRWQLVIWGVLGCVLLIPAGHFGRYVLINWPVLIEAIKTLLIGEYTLTRVTLPFPVFTIAVSQTIPDWIFLFYEMGVLFLLAKYVITYIRLRQILRKGVDADVSMIRKIQEVSHQYKLPVCRSVRVNGIASAFICGVFRPVLVLPESEEIDEKILVHELLHLKYRDTVWGVLICLLRCIHWCNPLLWYCADLAGNDIESLCDYRVLTLLEGEERRDYGRILLSMANEKYARTPGTSSMANGGRNISRRIEAIVRFKKYPAGMALVSVCIVIVLIFSMLVGVKAQVYNEESYFPDEVNQALSLASARTNWCTTPAGALDTYGKAVLTKSGTYRVMCAPMDMQESLVEEMHELSGQSSGFNAGLNTGWNTGLNCNPDSSQGYYVYNWENCGDDKYSALMVVPLVYPPNRQPDEEDKMYLAVQQVQVAKEVRRWVVIPQEEFYLIETEHENLSWGCDDLPSYIYSDTQSDFCVTMHYQRIFVIDNTISSDNDLGWFMRNGTSFDTIPKPDAEFDEVRGCDWTSCTYVGDEQKKEHIYQLGVSTAPMSNTEDRPHLASAAYGSCGGSSSDGTSYNSLMLESEWNSVIEMGGGGSMFEYDNGLDYLPLCYAADLYVNGCRAAEMTLQLQEGGAR